MKSILFLFLMVLWVAGCTPPNPDQNHLQKAHSPYLQDSIHDAIWWHPWGDQALSLAKTRDHLIFLSIGYTSCFACEKMQKNVFNQEEVAQRLNDGFVAIKVDREDRPDLDAYFLNMQSLIMGFGAWPINMILTPDLQPVYATTLLDKKQLMQILDKTAESWKNERHKILQGATRFQVQSQVQPSTEDFLAVDRKLINDFYARYTHRFDTLYGGKSTGRNFNTKFPVNDEMRLLLRYYLNTGEEQALKMVHKTMSSIVQGALFDQIQGGIHRYSTSRDWNTPNFEKMLYDQASFINALVDLHKIKQSDLYANALKKTVSFLINSAQDNLGGFYSSFAGSLDFKEGFYYTWDPTQLKDQLSPDELKAFNESYAFAGPHRNFGGRYTLRRKTTFVKPELEAIDQKLLQIRNQKGQPKADEKIITADNAYLLSSLSRLYRMWPSKDFYKTIQRNLEYIIRQHQTLSGEWYRRSLHGLVAEPAVLDDYAYMIDALIEFYQTEYEEKYLHLALELQKKQNALFWDTDRSLFRYSQNQEEFLVDQYVFIDQARPSGQSLSFWNLLRLSRYFIEIDFETMANKLVASYPDRLVNDPLSYSSLLLAVDFTTSKAKNFVVVGDQSECQKYLRSGFQKLQPHVLFSCDHEDSKLPLHKGKKAKDQGPTFYVCDTRSCQEPTNDYQKALKYIN